MFSPGLFTFIVDIFWSNGFAETNYVLRNTTEIVLSTVVSHPSWKLLCAFNGYLEFGSVV